MIVLISNNNGAALDNGAFAGFNEPAFYKLLFAAQKAKHAPRWVAVPDVVADRTATLALWQRWHDKVRAFGWPLAFIVQDGMIARDVPSDATVVFVGGSTAWKQQTAKRWCGLFPRVHIGRVNGQRDLERYHEMGAESCDGTGWFRGRRRQLDGLWYYLADTEAQERDHHHGPMQGRLFARGRGTGV